METLLHKRLAKEILNPENKTLKQAGEKAGYSGGNNSRNIYRANTKKHIAEILLKQGIGRDELREYFQALAKLAIKEKDLSNANRSGENIAKLYNLLKDNNIQQAVININDTIDKLKQPSIEIGQPKP